MSLEPSSTQSLAQSLASANLVPGPADGLIPEGFKPTVKLEVSYGSKAVDLGSFFRAGECLMSPTISFNAEVSVVMRGSSGQLYRGQQRREALENHDGGVISGGELLLTFIANRRKTDLHELRTP